MSVASHRVRRDWRDLAAAAASPHGGGCWMRLWAGRAVWQVLSGGGSSWGCLGSLTTWQVGARPSVSKTGKWELFLSDSSGWEAGTASLLPYTVLKLLRRREETSHRSHFSVRRMLTNSGHLYCLKLKIITWNSGGGVGEFTLKIRLHHQEGTFLTEKKKAE